MTKQPQNLFGDDRRCDRRTFLAAGAATLIAPRLLRGAEPAKLPTADTLVAGKNPQLIVHNARTFEIETPFELLRKHQVTPTELLFVRNNQQPAWSSTLQPPRLESWTLEVAGLVEFPRSISLASLMELPQVEHELVLQCSGNGRVLFQRAAPVKGSPWMHGAVGNVKFKGVPLRTVFEKFAVQPHASVRFLTAEGFEQPATPADADFEHSLPFADALERSFLAVELNGQPLPAVHGGPLRLVTPGYYGTMHVKWLSRLRLEAQETVNHHQVKRYRTPLHPIEPGSKFEYGLDNSEPNWNMRVKSVIFAPLEGEKVSAGRVTVKGVAWNDGQARIDAVELSHDGGKHWERADLQPGSSRYAWTAWQLELPLAAGQHTLLCRAVDTLGRTQPLDGAIDWNPAGYAWRGVHSITLTAT